MKYITFLLIIYLVVACKPKPTPKTYCEEYPGNCSDIQEVKDYFYFKIGSWWVYEEENSGFRDSVYVTEASNNPNNYQFDIRMHSSYQDFYYHYFPYYAFGIQSCQEAGSIHDKCVLLNRSKGKAGNSVGQSYCFFFTLKEGDQIANYNEFYTNNRVIAKKIYSTYELNGFNFSRTVKIHELNTLVEGKQPTNHYYSKGVGLIRKELLDSNQVWNLVDYHIAP